MIHYKFSMLKDLEQLQVEGYLTDTCVVGASSKVFADHVQHQPHSVCVWYQLDPGEGGNVIVIVPDATTDELETFVRKLYCPGDDVYYTAVQKTPIPVHGPPEVYHTAVPQTPLLPHRESVDSSEFNKRDIRHRLDMIKVRLSLLNPQRDEALA